jgi:hypothetical protein
MLGTTSVKILLTKVQNDSVSFIYIFSYLITLLAKIYIDTPRLHWLNATIFSEYDFKQCEI